MMYQEDTEDGRLGASINLQESFFGNKQIRHNFIKKVYSLLSIQLLISITVVALFSLHQDVHQWAIQNRWFHFASFAVAFTIMMFIYCLDKLRRKHPHNLIALFVFTIAEALMLASVTVMFPNNTVLIAAGITAVIVVSLTLFAMQTRYDFTTKSGIMVVLLMVACSAILIGLFLPPSKIFILVMSSIMAFIMGVFLVIDTQMIIGGSHSIKISPEEYVFATMNIYLDIVNMFFYILMILGRD